MGVLTITVRGRGTAPFACVLRAYPELACYPLQGFEFLHYKEICYET